MSDNQQSSTLIPDPLSRCNGEANFVTEMVVNHFRKSQ